MNAIELRNVTKTYPLFKVDNVSLDVKKGISRDLLVRMGRERVL